MTKFTFSSDDAAELAALSASREAYNANNPQNPMKTDQDYVSWYLSSWLGQLAIAYATSDAVLKAVLEAAKAANIDGAGKLIEARFPATPETPETPPDGA